MTNFNQYPSAESEVSEETLMELISAAQALARTGGTAGPMYDGQREVWLAAADAAGGELNVEILAYDHSLTIPEEARETGLILEINTSINYSRKPNGFFTWENHDYIVFNNDGELAVRKKFDIVSSDDPDIFELYRQGKITHLPTAPEHVRREIEEQAEKDREAQQLAEELRMNVPTEPEILDLITIIKAGKIEPVKNLDLARLTDDELHEELRKRLENEQ